MEYKVLRMHLGDKHYNEGDKRIVKNKKDAERLADKGLISLDGAEEVTEETSEEEPQAKQAKTPTNKMAKEPENKAE